MSNIQIPEPKSIEINRWYVCLIGQSEELCKITRYYITDPYVPNKKNSGWEVVCYYTGRDLFSGSLADCRLWLRDRLYLLRRG